MSHPWTAKERNSNPRRQTPEQYVLSADRPGSGPDHACDGWGGACCGTDPGASCQGLRVSAGTARTLSSGALKAYLQQARPGGRERTHAPDVSNGRGLWFPEGSGLWQYPVSTGSTLRAGNRREWDVWGCFAAGVARVSEPPGTRGPFSLASWAVYWGCRQRCLWGCAASWCWLWPPPWSRPGSP